MGLKQPDNMRQFGMHPNIYTSGKMFFKNLAGNTCEPIFALPKQKRCQTFFNKKDLVAQLVEQYTFNVWVLGSSPSQITSGTSQK